MLHWLGDLSLVCKLAMVFIVEGKARCFNLE